MNGIETSATCSAEMASCLSASHEVRKITGTDTLAI